MSTVHGDESVRAGLLGATYSWEDWESTLSERFRRGGAYLVYDGDMDWEQQSGKRIVLDEVATADGPDAWRSEDELFVPFHHSDGSMLGIFNVCSPESGLRPTDEDLEVLTLVVRHAARAVQRAQDAANAAAHRRGLEELLRVSSKLTETVSPAAVLHAICSGISQGLGFGRVLVQLRAEDSELLVSAAGVGIETEDVSTRFVLHDGDLERLLDLAFETEGCYLLPLEEAKRRVPSYHDTFPSVTNGRGPAAWDRHWLVVPLVDRTGARLGAVFADDPSDRLLPSRERLQALRLFANQATSALESSAQYETMRYLADRDPLTKLLNRRAFVRHLGDAAVRARETGAPLSLVYCDLDGFKAVNDSRGHADGDRLLRAFGDVLTAAVRRDDAAFRMGGDEFALLLEGCSRERALEVVERVVEHLEAECLAIGASFGVAVADARDPSTATSSCAGPTTRCTTRRARARACAWRPERRRRPSPRGRAAARSATRSALDELAVGEDDLADEDHVPVGELGAGHAAPVHARAVRRAVVENAHRLGGREDDRVPPRDGLVLEAQVRAPGAADVGRARGEAEETVLVAVLDDEVPPGRGLGLGNRPQARAVTHARQRVKALGLGREIGRGGRPGRVGGGGHERGGHAWMVAPQPERSRRIRREVDTRLRRVRRLASCARAGSSVGQSSGLIIRSTQVRVLPGPCGSRAKF